MIDTGISMFPVFAVVWMAACLFLVANLAGPDGSRCRPVVFLYTTLASTVFCLLWHWPRFPVYTNAGFYPGDSLYTLGPFAASALACLTVVLLLCAAYTSWRVTCVVLPRVNVQATVAILAGVSNGILLLLLYWVLLSVVPQLYYTIYLQLFPDLPAQWVVRQLIPARQFLSILHFDDQPTLSSHAAGLLGWVLFVNAVIQWLSGGKPDRTPESA